MRSLLCTASEPPPGGTSKVYRAGSLPLGERGRVPCGKHSPGGSSKVYRAGRLPLGEREGVPVREAFPWGNK